MCIICVSPKRVRQPSLATIRTMFRHNPHGAGYMFARNGKVEISKGYMDVDSYIAAIRAERFTAKDAVVYHFRISTQAGVNPQMTHPFPLSNRRAHMKALDVDCQCGIAHNGIIRLTTDPTNREYSDTAIFITDYLARIIRTPADLRNRDTLSLIQALAGSKLAIMDAGGYIATVGDFISDHRLLYSNGSFMA
jgi:predicted glutamine amidotransferase